MRDSGDVGGKSGGGAGVGVQDLRLRYRYVLTAVSKKKIAESIPEEASQEEVVAVEKKTRKTTRRAPAARRKKVVLEAPEENSVPALDGNVAHEETKMPSGSSEDIKKAPRRTRKKAYIASDLEEEDTEKKVIRRRRTKKKVPDIDDQGSETEFSHSEEDTFLASVDDDNGKALDFGKDGDEDISFTYGWPPLVCCFGAAQHAFLPSGRPANRLTDYEMHKRMKDALWAPDKFVRSPGGCASNVALALASLGGKVAFMGKLGDDDFGQSLLYYLNENKVQTRSVRIDNKRATAVSQMKIGKRRALRMTYAKPCAEDSLSRSEISTDVLKEARMFYFNSFSLLEQKMRSTALHAIKMSKKLGAVIFYDLNLPLPLWQSGEETKMFIQQAWDLADIIEVTKQELEFLCGIKASEQFDTRDNDKSKFVHHKPEVLAHLWHDNLKVLFVTNGTIKVHYYTKEHNGAVLGMEDAPLTPFTTDLLATGDGIVAGLIRMLTVQPHLITDKGYLETTIKYAINSGVIDQWLQARSRGFPPKEGIEEDMVPDPNGIVSITEREHRTLVPVI
ncbi:hypothetical protein RJ639_027130 [Escallonia herrerae]|uniref:Carbohydrate kinase PfkB domain-containing protein n=1 Tax=Escallonia herrerae TaxID=1293975 RepID=A0AA88X503_9ASTE|nr:hypothetical protein RJ639_027130 [Escallonia herrerae]